MKIAILSFYSSLRVRGVETFVEQFTAGLGKIYEIEVFQADKTNKKFYDENPVKILRKLYLDYQSRQILIFTVKVLKKLIKDRPSVLMPTNNGWQTILCKLYSFFFKVPLILAGHAGPGWDDYVNLKINPDIFVAFSTAQASWAKKILRQ